ncbi:MAG: hypothetical protein AAFY03_12375 [Pseudomonadota bacterium]
MSDDFSTLDGIHAALWRRLELAAHGKTGPARYLVLATRGMVVGAEARMVVLRQADRSTAKIGLHTHALSHKVAELAADPVATLLMWDPAHAFQARLKVVTDTVPGTDADWARVPATGRRLNYGSLPPAMPIAAPNVIAEAHENRDAFIKINAEIEAIDALLLGEQNARRARYSRELEFQGRWIAP